MVEGQNAHGPRFLEGYYEGIRSEPRGSGPFPLSSRNADVAFHMPHLLSTLEIGREAHFQRLRASEMNVSQTLVHEDGGSSFDTIAGTFLYVPDSKD